MEMDEKAPGYSDILKIHEAGLRGAELVRNLLAFSRKAETKPRPINLNHEVVTDREVTKPDYSENDQD